MSRSASRVLVAAVPGAAVVGAVVVGLVLWQGQLARAPGGEPNAPGAQAEGLDPAAYARVCEVRRGLGLSDPALAAMGCGQGAAEAVLGRLVTWCEANRAAWEARRSATADARRRVREAVREANVGPADPGRARRIAQLEAALPAAVADETNPNGHYSEFGGWGEIAADERG